LQTPRYTYPSLVTDNSSRPMWHSQPRHRFSPLTIRCAALTSSVEPSSYTFRIKPRQGGLELVICRSGQLSIAAFCCAVYSYMTVSKLISKGFNVIVACGHFSAIDLALFRHSSNRAGTIVTLT